MARLQRRRRCRTRQNRLTLRRRPGQPPLRIDNRTINSSRAMLKKIILTSERGRIPTSCEGISPHLPSKIGRLKMQLCSRHIRKTGWRTRATSETTGATRKTTANGQKVGTQVRTATRGQVMSTISRSNSLRRHNRRHQAEPRLPTLAQMTRPQNRAGKNMTKVGPMGTTPAQVQTPMTTQVLCMRRLLRMRGKTPGSSRWTRRRGRESSVTGPRRAA